MSTKLTEIEAAIRVRMSPRLLRWLTSHAPKHGHDRKLPFTKKGDEYFYDSGELDSFNEYLKQRWPCPEGQKRPIVPAGIEKEILIEANHKCAFCEYIAHGEGAHIDPVAKSGCNHPHNLIWACPNHHTEYDHGLKVKTTITHEHVKLLKEVLLEAQLRPLRIELRACSGLLSFISELEIVSKYLKDPRLSDIKKGLQGHARDVLKLVREEAKKPVIEKNGPKVSENYKGFLKQVGEIIPARDTTTQEELSEAVEEVVEATEEYLNRESLAKCPLCKGGGDHNRFRCPVCSGEGTVLKQMLHDIDLSPYEQKKCPLCKGAGEHNRFDCPICAGVGTVDVQHYRDIDLSPYEQKKCPLCNGTGTHNRFDCPICSGEGTVDVQHYRDIDLSPYEQKKCPLCKGTGTHNRFDCPICSGEGTVDIDRVHDIDLTPYEQVKCPLCKGKGNYKGEECPVCHGDGEVDSVYADNVDLDQF